MTNRVIDFFGTAADGVALVLPVNMQPQDDGFQITVEGTFPVTVETQEYNGGYIQQTILTTESLNVFLENVENVRITATGGTADYTVRLKQNRVSTTVSNWETTNPVVQ
tara:strand:- start:2136 stop:2462 length:327 start_codon:yes stop_codon:yes gene_type:complete